MAGSEFSGLGFGCCRAAGWHSPTGRARWFLDQYVARSKRGWIGLQAVHVRRRNLQKRNKIIRVGGIMVQSVAGGRGGTRNNNVQLASGCWAGGSG